MENTNTFAVRLKQIREEREMTQKAFSSYLDIKQQTLSGYEIGKISPSLEVAFDIAQKLNVSLDWLCGASEKRNVNQEYKTCADVIEALYTIDLENDVKIDSLYFPDVDGWKFCIRFSNEHFQSFFSDWKKMLDLYHSNTISKQLYDLWMREQVRIYSEYPLNDLPFERESSFRETD